MGMFHLKHVQGLYALVDTKVVGKNDWKVYIDAFIFGCKVNNLTENSVNSYAERLGYLVRYLQERQINIEDVTRLHLQEYIYSLVGKLSDITVNGRIQAMQRFWNYLEQEGIWKKPNPMHRIKRIKIEKKLKEVVTEEDVSRVISVVNKNSFVGYRNMTMLMLFFDTMIRRNELITLTIENVDLKNGIVKVFGKGRKWREVAMGTKMVKTMHFYLNRWRQDIPGDLVFCTHDGKSLDKDNVRHIIFRMGKRVGIHLHPHLLRHSAATWFIRHGGSPALLQRIMGHTSPVVTAGYTHLNSQDMVDSYQRLSPANAIRV
jgi:integrase/recombinase XerD